MKSIILFVASTLLGCAGEDHHDWNHLDRIELPVTVINVLNGKYTRIEGYVHYKGILMYVNNGHSGYYRKKYSLKEGDVINIEFDVYSTSESMRTYIELSPMDVSRYEIND